MPCYLIYPGVFYGYHELTDGIALITGHTLNIFWFCVSPLRLELSMFWSFFFSFSDKNSNISWGLLRAVTIDPRNFCGLFLINSIGWLIPFSVRLKLIPVVYILQYCLNCSGWKPVIIFILSSTAPIVLDTDDCILTKTKMRGDIILH